MFDDNSLHAKFLMGEPIDIGVCVLYPLKLIQIIKDIGFDLYNQYLSILCATSDEIKVMLDIEFDEQYENEIIEPFDYLVSCCLLDEKTKNTVILALQSFIKEDIEFCNEGYFYIGNINSGRYIHRSNFNFISDILRQQNCVPPTVEKIKPKNKRQLEHYKKQKKINAQKNKNKENEIPNIISAVAAKHPSINLFNIGNLTIYQLIDQYKRLNLIDEYFMNIDSLIHGASNEQMQLMHWGSHLD